MNEAKATEAHEKLLSVQGILELDLDFVVLLDTGDMGHNDVSFPDVQHQCLRRTKTPFYSLTLFFHFCYTTLVGWVIF